MSSAPRNPSSVQPWSGAVVAALLLTLERPAAWAVALAGFLARGGLLALLVPILALPTPAGLQTMISPLIVPFHFGVVAPGFVALVTSLIAITAAWIVVGGLVGAWADAHLARQPADDLARPAWTREEPDVVPPGLAVVAGVLATRLIAHVPLAAALAWGSARIVQATYEEVTTPFEVVSPIALRVVTAVPDAVAAVTTAWLLGEAAGGLGARELALGGRGPLRAAVEGWLGLVRRPLASAATLLVTGAVVVAAVAPGLLAAGAAWRWVRSALYEGAGPVEQVGAIGVFVGLWIATIALAAFAVAFRTNAWTAEWRRRVARPSSMEAPAPPTGWPVGTIGDSEATRPGGWPSSGASGTV